MSNLAQGLVKIGHDVTAYCSDRPLSPGRSTEEWVRVVRMNTPMTLYGTPIAGFPKEFRTEDCDLIHCNFPNPYFSIVSAGQTLGMAMGPNYQLGRG